MYFLFNGCGWRSVRRLIGLLTVISLWGPGATAAEGLMVESFIKSINKGLGAGNLRPALAPDFFAEELAGVRTAYWNSTRQMKSARVPQEIGPLCIHEFKDVPTGDGGSEFCILRRWMIITNGVAAEDVARRVLVSDMLPHDTTMFADFAARIINPSNCQQSNLPTTKEEKERLDYIGNWTVTNPGDPVDGYPFWTVQIMSGPLVGERVSMAYYSRSRLDDGTMLLTDVQGKSFCNFQDNAYSSRLSTTMVVPGRDRHLVYALSASCLNPNRGNSSEAKQEIAQIQQFRGKIHSMFCEDADSKFQILRKSLESR